MWSSIWYIPMNKMRLSGYELLLASLALPALLAFGWFRRLCQRFAGLRVLSLIGLASPFIFSHAIQICCLAIGTAVSTTFLLLDVVYYNPFPVAAMTYYGSILLMILRWANASLNPVFHSRWIAVAFALVGFGSCFQYSRHRGAPQLEPPAGGVGFVVVVGTFFGAALFTCHALLTQIGVLCRWLELPINPFSWLWFVSLILSGRFVLFRPGQTLPFAFCGLLLLLTRESLWLSAAFLLPVFASQLPLALVFIRQSGRVGLAVAVGMLVYSAFGLATVWTVAFPFVPGGSWLREKTHHVFYLSAAALLISVALVQRCSRPTSVFRTLS